MNEAEEKSRILKTAGCGTVHYSSAKGSATLQIRGAILTVLLACLSLSAQSAPTHSGTFRVRGTVRGFADSVMPRAEVTFKSERITKTVSSDSRGVYRAELPVGAYTMTASWAGEEKYRRPIFRVKSKRTITLDIILYPDPPDCDTLVWTLVSPNGTYTGGLDPDGYRDVCGGQDDLPISSKDGPSFDLLVQYGSRHRSASENTYSSYIHLGPVFVAYNLFSLEADKVVYDMKDRTIAASGNVVVSDGSGTTHHADSLGFRIEDGQVIPLN